jgi:hypothetical protein
MGPRWPPDTAAFYTDTTKKLRKFDAIFMCRRGEGVIVSIGNLFLRAPVASTCRGARTLAQARDPILQSRACTQEAGIATADGMPTTFCHFLLTGRCEEAASFTVDSTHYAAAIFTYLRPSTPSEAGTP